MTYLRKFYHICVKTIRSYLSMLNSKSTSFEMTELKGAGEICPTPPHVRVILKTPCGIGLNANAYNSNKETIVQPNLVTFLSRHTDSSELKSLNIDLFVF